MDAQRAYLVIAVAAAFGMAFALVRAAASSAVERGRARRAYGRAVATGRADVLLRNGVRPLRPLARKLLAFAPVRAWADSMAAALGSKGRETNGEALCSLAAGTCLLLAAAGYAAGSWAGAAALPCAAMLFATGAGSRALEKHGDLLRDQLPDALRAMSACFHAGLSVDQTFAQLAHEVPRPLGAVFQSASQRMQTGASVPQALDDMRRRSGLAEIAFLSVALQVQHQAGGSMQHVLDATGDVLDGELELKRSLRVHTAQARLSARVVVGVTVLLVLVLSVLSEDFLAAFFQSALGMALLVVAVGMQVAGIVAVRRLLNVQVD